MSEDNDGKIDLTSDPINPDTPSIETKKYDPNESREKLRGTIALILVWTLVGTIVLMLGIMVYLIDKTDKIIQLFPVILSPLVGIVGTVIGFYFGALTKEGG